jgi:hypothetical protein
MPKLTSRRMSPAEAFEERSYVSSFDWNILTNSLLHAMILQLKLTPLDFEGVRTEYEPEQEP